MPTWFGGWLLLAGGIGMVWAARWYVMGVAMRHRIVLAPDTCDPPLHKPPRISVIVAAKDEEDNIEACITTLLDQNYPNVELIAVDDRSHDRTAAILERLKQRCDSRLRVVTVTSVREGWFGKNNAMREGVAVSSGDWLLFTDADCRQTSRATLSTAMRDALEHNVDFLCITPRLETHTAWERILQPVCALVLIARFQPIRVNDPKSKTAYANGAFMLMRRSCYDAIGGHDCVRTQVNEDIHMARLAKRSGLRLRVVENENLYSVRMYRTLREAWRGWSRIFYGCLTTVPRLALAALLVATFTVVPWVSLVGALVGWTLGSTTGTVPWSLALLVWGCVVGMEQLVTARFYGILRIGRLWSLM